MQLIIYPPTFSSVKTSELSSRPNVVNAPEVSFTREQTSLDPLARALSGRVKDWYWPDWHSGPVGRANEILVLILEPTCLIPTGSSHLERHLEWDEAGSRDLMPVALHIGPLKDDKDPRGDPKSATAKSKMNVMLCFRELRDSLGIKRTQTWQLSVVPVFSISVDS